MIDTQLVYAVTAVISLTLLSGMFWFILRYAK